MSNDSKSQPVFDIATSIFRILSLPTLRGYHLSGIANPHHHQLTTEKYVDGHPTLGYSVEGILGELANDMPLHGTHTTAQTRANTWTKLPIEWLE